MSAPIELVHNYTDDGLKLSGLYTAGDKQKAAVVHIHGFCGDFYASAFPQAIADKLAEQGNAILRVEHRGTAMHSEFLLKDGGYRNIGSYYEVLEEAHLDISAWVQFLLDEGYENIVLSGHSLGTIKVTRYLFEGQHKDKIKKLILLAPFEKNGFMEMKAPSKWLDYVAEAKEQVEAGNGERVVPKEYEDYPMTYQTFYSWYQQNDLSNMWDFRRKDYDFPIMKQINIPVKVILGSKDQYIHYDTFEVTPQDSLDVMKQHIKDCQTVLVEGAKHSYNGYEDQVATEVANFLI